MLRLSAGRQWRSCERRRQQLFSSPVKALDIAASGGKYHFVVQAGPGPLPQFGSAMSAGRTSPSFTYAPTYSPAYAPADAPTYAPTFSPAYSPTYSPAYRPTSPVQSDPSSPQYRPTSPCHLPQRRSDRYPAVYDYRPEYSEVLARIELNDPSLTHVFLKPSLNPLFGHPEYEFSGEPVLSDAELSELADALAANTCITSLDLSGLALGSQAASLMRSIVRMTSLASLDLRDNGITATDSSRVFKCAADAGMTQLSKLMLCEPSRYLQTVGVRDVTACAEWARLKLPALQPSADFADPSDSTALLKYTINSIIADHALACIAISKFATFRKKIPLFLHGLACPPPRIVSQRQQQRLLASGGFALLLLRRISSPRDALPGSPSAQSVELGITSRVKGAAAAVFVLGNASCHSSARSSNGSSSTWPVLWPPALMLSSQALDEK